MDLANLKIINISFNQVNGGSISLDIAKKKSKYKENKVLLKWLLLRENLNGFNDLNIQKSFLKMLNFILRMLVELIKIFYVRWWRKSLKLELQ